MSRKVLGLSAVFAMLAGLALTGGNQVEAGLFGGHKKSCGCYQEQGCFKKVKHSWFKKKHRKNRCCGPVDTCCAPVDTCCAPASCCAPAQCAPAPTCCAPAPTCEPACAPATCCAPAATCCAPAPSCAGSSAAPHVEDAPPAPAPPAEEAPAPAPAPKPEA
ncbi:hypothetical protein [Symmachiella dynata]|uniref:Uncharacterized protein n=1 Tax=Symmachiella dynata TaxID=2527995 RepID=A0A517ZR95_9PLAN|nr:hypothetical protein [Symmachiella dynata]QDT49300.1 hypothetical protein Pan258_33470 [Symmachiella dynata]QDU44968.1 hypothetical protein Mal52_34540 [Symmachiella dynata]